MNIARCPSLWVLGLLGLLVLTPIRPALAVPPTIETAEFSGAFVYPAGHLCAFPLEVAWEGRTRIKTYFDQNGKPIKAIHTYPTVKVTVTNLAIGKALPSYPRPVPTIITFNADGTVAAATFNGLIYRVTVPGESLLFHDVGKLVLDLNTGDIVFEAGPHQFYHDGHALFCSAFAPDAG